MPAFQRLVDSTGKLVAALLVFAALFSHLRQRGVGDRLVALGIPGDTLQSWLASAVVHACTALFAIGLGVRLRRWLAERAADSARRRRLETAHTLVGAPERSGGRRAVGSGNRPVRRR